jgi:putative acetyltransferase
MPLLIEPESTADIPAIRELVLAAFADEPAVDDLVDDIRSSRQYEPELSLVARIDGRVAGFVMISHAELVEEPPSAPHRIAGGSVDHSDGPARAGAEAADAAADQPAGPTGGVRRHDVLTLSPLAVAPDRQRHGIGSALVRAVLAAADLAGGGLVTLEGSPTFYGRLGFRPAAAAGVTMHLPDWAPPEAAQVFLLSGYRSAVRGRLVYPPAFDAVT